MNSMMQLILIYVILIVIIFLPTYISNKKKREAKAKLIDSLKVGSKVVTIGGIKGEVVAVLEDSVEVKVDKGTKITILKSAISTAQ